MIQPLTVLGVGAHVAYPRASAEQVEATKYDLSLLERPLRRGLSEVTKLFLHTAKLALAQAAIDPAGAQVVYGSAFGEIGTAEALLAEAYDADSSSPARFRHSVHNTPPGLFSISKQSSLPSTALAAGWDTVPMGLLEAATQLAGEAEHVLLVFAEERVPSAISCEYEHDALAVALVLGRTGEGLARLRGLRRVARVGAPDVHPLGAALRLFECIEGRRSATLALGDGEQPWSIGVECAP